MQLSLEQRNTSCIEGKRLEKPCHLLVKIVKKNGPLCTSNFYVLILVEGVKKENCYEYMYDM